jgi:hypothetical protein
VPLINDGDQSQLGTGRTADMAGLGGVTQCWPLNVMKFVEAF